MVRHVVRHTLVIPPELAGRRLDQALASLLPEHSRSRIKGWIEAECVRVDGAAARPRQRLAGGERVEVDAAVEAEEAPAPEPMPLRIVHEEAHLIVLDKPAGLVVHPAAGNPRGTLVNALLAHDPALAVLPRAGLVHRLDKDTSGLLLVARTPEAHTRLVRAMQARAIARTYLAVVNGVVTAGGTVDAPVGRHPVDRKRMAVVPAGRPAVTHYRVRRRFRAHTLLEVRLETGRTHQIRVHMAHLRHPVTGDPVYGGRPRLPRDPLPALAERVRAMRRQALHAARLAFAHPLTGTPLAFASPLPADLAALLEALEEDLAAHG
ncbi:23S rRNA pseudouridine(1911/1915/1917) synthase RluD [Inmirania thermothiophila]|uniref:Pseudouridine synthase n=1 Tax=Inmirania thermothiophila TaxID=1750597 RepID=A0A3N1Y7F5_9GAMM|nr:23S rRNA pseudouridine(1911/1915/1917) synthase RluD [Inmirania thermothiophila]ROR34705.1 ribosomal large subunit pseudouridine synthase D [Inmirania thermothiophila]